MRHDSIAGRPRERGSAYIITLLCLVVLSILGLSLALVTQTEMQIGANEITQQRGLYAADSGISHANSRAAAEFSCAAITGASFTIADQDASSYATLANLREEVTVTATVPMLDAPCALCMVNNAGGSIQMGEQTYYQVHHAVSADAKRVSGPVVPDPASTAQRTVGAFISLQPWPQIGSCFGEGWGPEAAKVRM